MKTNYTDAELKKMSSKCLGNLYDAISYLGFGLHTTEFTDILKRIEVVRNVRKQHLKQKSNHPVSPLPDKIIQNNIFFLELLKKDAFHGDHPGIDKMVKEMKAELKIKGSQKVKKPSKRDLSKVVEQLRGLSTKRL
jgi:hypothetical protein